MILAGYFMIFYSFLLMCFLQKSSLEQINLQNFVICFKETAAAFTHKYNTQSFCSELKNVTHKTIQLAENDAKIL